MKKIFLGLCVIIFCSCGSESDPLANIDSSVVTQTPPIILRVAPNSGKAGDTITIFGFGFSIGAANNIILVGGVGATAQTYTLLDPPANGEIESLTFVVPATAIIGATTVAVQVFDLVSNSDVSFTVTP